MDASQNKSIELLPEELDFEQFKKLSKPKNYIQRLKFFKNDTLLPDIFIDNFANDIRRHAIEPETTVILVTINGNRNNGLSKCQGYHLYNPQTNFNAFFDLNKRFKTAFTLNRTQRLDLINNSNIM